MHNRFSPPTVAPPLGAYSHGLGVVKDPRWVFISGQLGRHPDGTVAEDAEGQLVAEFQAIGYGKGFAAITAVYLAVACAEAAITVTAISFFRHAKPALLESR